MGRYRNLTKNEGRVSPAHRRVTRMTQASLERAALEYLARYPTSQAHFRAVLQRKVDRSLRSYGGDPIEAQRWIEALARRLRETGLLDDRKFAASRARALFRRGVSAGRIRSLLQSKGVAQSDIDDALAGLSDMASAPELAAALIYARRRRIGPFRVSEERAAFRRRDLASLGRQGFGYDLARRVVDCQELDVLEAEAGLWEA